MTVPFNKLDESDAQQRLELGWRLLREAHSSTRWDKMQVEKLLARGENEPDYWKSLWSSHVNYLSRYDGFFTAETQEAGKIPQQTQTPQDGETLPARSEPR